MSMFNETQGHVNILWRNTHMYNHIPHKDTYGYTVNLSWGPCNFYACVCCSMRILTYLFGSVKFERLLNNKVISFIPRIHDRFPRDNIATLKNDDYFFHSLSS